MILIYFIFSLGLEKERTQLLVIVVKEEKQKLSGDVMITKCNGLERAMLFPFSLNITLLYALRHHCLRNGNGDCAPK